MNNYKFFKSGGRCQEKAEACINFFTKLSELLREDYEIVHSNSREYVITHKHWFGNLFRISDHYLVPFGTKSQITYYNKPYWSFRLSDHWNWYDTIEKCEYRNQIQCFNVDLPRGKRYTNDDKRSDPVSAFQVAIYGNHDDEAYHCVYGAYKDKNTHEWCWMEKTPEEVVNEYALI